MKTTGGRVVWIHIFLTSAQVGVGSFSPRSPLGGRLDESQSRFGRREKENILNRTGSGVARAARIQSLSHVPKLETGSNEFIRQPVNHVYCTRDARDESRM
jgi:hypothetical protein